MFIVKDPNVVADVDLKSGSTAAQIFPLNLQGTIQTYSTLDKIRRPDISRFRLVIKLQNKHR